MSYGFIRGKRILAVCTDEITKPGESEFCDTQTWDVLHCASFDEILKYTRERILDAVALRFDPHDFECRRHFHTLYELQKDGRPLLMSHAMNNAVWVENLAYTCGANLHLKFKPTLNNIVSELDEFMGKKLEFSLY